MVYNSNSQLTIMVSDMHWSVACDDQLYSVSVACESVSFEDWFHVVVTCI